MGERPGISLRTTLSDVAGIPARTVKGLEAMGLTNVGKLVAHLPARHERLEAEGAVRDLVPGQNVSARGEIAATRVVPHGRKPRFEAVLTDGSGRLDLVWFNQTYLRDRIQPGARLRVEGVARRFGPGIQLANPKYDLLSDSSEPGQRDARLRPVYPASELVGSEQIERAIGVVLEGALAKIEDHLPEAFRRERGLPELAAAYRMMHAPESVEEALGARRRLAYDELLLLQLGVHLKRTHLRETLKSPALKHTEAIDRHIRQRLPFSLTPGQETVIAEIARDLSHATPTNRLIQGDVGSGKTVVALYAMLMAVASGHQGALMAPTEILAEQHFASIGTILAGSRVRVRLLTGATGDAERVTLLAALAAGSLDILIGTHALLTETVKFKSLAVAVIDEQHRFGVHQRARLRAKAEDGASTPHVLVMTATPIPRTVALTLFGDLDISTIRGLPPGRRPIVTRVVGQDQREAVYAFVRRRLDAGEQAYIVVPAIDAEDGSLADVRGTLEELEAGALVGTRIAALHGRLKQETRDTIMARFRSGQIAALVATTVIEVGVDVPNATVMVVEHADRFGLAQLHQLRGRIGRGEKDSECVLIGDPKTPDALTRLQSLAATTDGFAIAEKDLELRGPGEVFGIKQAGAPPLRVADLMRDRDLLVMARRDAAAWVAASSTLGRPEELLLKQRLLKQHGKWLGIGDVG